MHRHVSSLTAALLLAACATGAPTPSPEGAPAAPVAVPAGASHVRTGEGVLEAPIPPEWRAQVAADGHAILLAPEGDLAIHVGSSGAATFEEAARDAWASWAAGARCDALPPQPAPAPEGVEELQVAGCRVEPGQPFGQLVGQRAQGRWHVVLIYGALDTLQRRNAQALTVLSGLQIAGVERVDLSGRTPLPWDDARRAELRRFIEAQRQRLGVPGVAVAVVDRSGVVLEEGFGSTSQRGGAPMTPETRMMIGSTTKPLTVLLLGSLVQEGLARWDQPVAELMPTFRLADPEATRSLQLQHMVCACTGVPRRDMDLLMNADALTPQAVLESLQDYPLYTRPGEAFQYSNQMIAAGGYIGATVLGAKPEELGSRYAQGMQERVFGPLGMTQTTLEGDPAVEAAPHGAPHYLSPDGGWAPLDPRAERIVRPVNPAGGVWSSARDMGRLAGVLLRGGLDAQGQRVIAQETLQAAWTPRVQVKDRTHYGLGWFLGQHQGLQVIQHGGNNLGFTSEFTLVPQADLGVVVLMNTQGTNVLGRAIWRRAVELRYDLPHKNDEDIELFKQNAARNIEDGLRESDLPRPGEAEPWLGAWSHPRLGTLRLLRDEAGVLRLESRVLGGPLRVQRHPDGSLKGFMIADGPLLGMPWRAERDLEGAPALVLGFGVDAYTLRRPKTP